MRPWFTIFFTFASLWSGSYAVFSFEAGKPTQCDDFSVSWTGGTAPFRLLLSPAFGTPRNITIPDSAFSGGKGSFKTQLLLDKGKRFLATMSDATGFGSGGISSILTVEGSTGSGNCNTTDPGVDFTFETNSALQQCRAYTFSNYGGAQKPIQIFGLIPSGTSFVLNPPKSANSYDWTANVAQGTNLMFVMIDSAGRQGGASDIVAIGASSETTCLNDSSPSSTGSAPTATSSGSNTPSKSGTSTAAIAGTVIGALVFLSVVITLGLFFLRRRQHSARADGAGGFTPFSGRHSRRMQSGIDLMGDSNDPFTGNTPHGYRQGDPSHIPNSPNSHLPAGHEPEPFVLTTAPSLISPYGGSSEYGSSRGESREPQYGSSFSPYEDGPSQHGGVGAQSQHGENLFNRDRRTTLVSQTDSDPFGAQSLGSNMTASQRKRAMAGVPAYTPSRFIMHTDISDEIPPNSDGVVELPPQYSERRPPIDSQRLTGAVSSSGSSSTPDHQRRPSQSSKKSSPYSSPP